MVSSPTQRTREWLKSRGYRSGIVEKWNQFAKVRQDLYGCIDIVASKPGEPVTGIQACVGGDLTKRTQKIRELTFTDEAGEKHELLPFLLASGWRIRVFGWRRLKPRGQARPHWAVRIYDMGTEQEFEDTVEGEE
jgi:hypothetical protein